MFMQKLLWLALAGSLGTLSRYGLGGLMQRLIGSSFPWGTITINLLGCFGFGVIWTLLESRLSWSGEIKTIFLVGFMGAFTTFSTYIFETASFLQDSEWLPALANFTIQNLAGVLLLFAGMALGRLI